MSHRKQRNKLRQSAVALMMVAGGLAAALPALTTPAFAQQRDGKIDPCVSKAKKKGAMDPCFSKAKKKGAIDPCFRPGGAVAPAAK